MKLVDLLGICGESKEVFVYEWCNDGNTPLLAHYDGKDSIPESLNDCVVKTFTDLNNLTVMVEVPKTPTLAERLDRVMYRFDPYSYDSEECSVEEAERAIKESPETVIEELLGMLESQMEEK